MPAGLKNIPRWRVMTANVLPEYRLELIFHDGLAGVVDLSALIQADDAGVFESLRDPAIFASVQVDCAAPSWPGDIDLAPDALYAAIKADSPFPIPHSRIQTC